MRAEEIKKMEKFIENLPKEKIAEENKKEFEEVKLQYEEFSKQFTLGNCIFCNSKLSDFNENIPCMHWLLRPAGFRKKHFKLITDIFNYSRIDAYLRWVANQEAFLININDLTEEQRDSKIFEYTIRYKDLEWSFSCSKGDFEGHKNSRWGRSPHYHFQMRLNKQQFINFSEFHILLTHYDTFVIHTRRREIKGISSTGFFGAGVKDLFESVSPEEILKNAKTVENAKDSSIHTSYIIEAEHGKTLSGDELADLFEESKKTKTPMWNLLHKLKNVGTKKAIISPGEGVVEMAKREGGRK